MKHLKHLLQDESGATAIEYGLIASIISIAAIIFYNQIGGDLDRRFNAVADATAQQAPGGGGAGG